MNEEINELFYSDPIYSAIILKALITTLKQQDKKLFSKLEWEINTLYNTDKRYIGEEYKEIFSNLHKILKNI